MASGGGNREPTDDPLDALVRAGLGELCASLLLELSAYVHDSPAMGRRLFFEAPASQPLDDADAFEVLNAMARVLDAERQGHARIGPFACVTVASRGPAGRGLFAFGRRAAALSSDEEVIVLTAARALGAGAHALELAGETGAAWFEPPGASEHAGVRPARVAVEVSSGECRADVWLVGPGDDCKGAGTASATFDAVAMATLDALEVSARVREVGERLVGGTPVVVVVLEGSAGRVSAGAAPRGSDPLQATAAATLAAVAMR